MQATLQPPDGLENIIDEIGVLSEIARRHGSLVSLKDLVSLTRTQLSEDDLKFWWERTPRLAEGYELRNGLILERGSREVWYNHNRLAAEQAKKSRAEKYAGLARIFSALSSDQETRLLAISGSTSYKTASESDDLDFFCITRSSHLWIFLTKSLLLARLLRVSRRDFPRICFSYATDEDFAEKEFLRPKDGLFARDALNAIVIHGEEYYRDLLKKSSWISDYFPRLYRSRATSKNIDREGNQQRASPPKKFLNILLRLLVGNYIVLKSGIHNRKLRRQNKLTSLFTAKVGIDYCIFESVRYGQLRSVYQKLRSMPSQSDSSLAQQHGG